MNTQQQLIKDLEQATFRGTWEEASKAQQQLDQLVQDRKTGEFYNPQEAFDAMMNKPEILAVFKRLSIR
jgi:ribosomal protein L17